MSSDSAVKIVNTRYKTHAFSNVRLFVPCSCLFFSFFLLSFICLVILVAAVAASAVVAVVFVAVVVVSCC